MRATLLVLLLLAGGAEAMTVRRGGGIPAAATGGAASSFLWVSGFNVSATADATGHFSVWSSGAAPDVSYMKGATFQTKAGTTVSAMYCVASVAPGSGNTLLIDLVQSATNTAGGASIVYGTCTITDPARTCCVNTTGAGGCSTLAAATITQNDAVSFRMKATSTGGSGYVNCAARVE